MNPNPSVDHGVLVVKNRKTSLDDEAVRIATETAGEIGERDEREFERTGGDGDHVHRSNPVHPKMVPGQITRGFKSVMAREIFRRRPDVKKVWRGGEFRTNGYFVATIGEYGNGSVVRRNVRNRGLRRENWRQIEFF
jgi:putative transposase